MRPILPLLLCSLSLIWLTGCGSIGGQDRSLENQANTAAFEDQIPVPYQLAICAGDYREALSNLPPRYRDDPLTLFMAAYALESSGHVVRAHPHYQLLADTGFQDPVRLVCGGEALFDGPLASVSFDRAQHIERTLTEMDADLNPTRTLHDGLPPQRQTEADTNSQSTASSTSPPPSGRTLRVGGARNTARAAGSAQNRTTVPRTISVSRPDSLDPLGRWFVHLSSYFADDNAAEGRAALATLYPGYKGLFDSWQVDLKGRRTWRLGLRLSNEQEARAICTRLDTEGLYCAVFDNQNN